MTTTQHVLIGEYVIDAFVTESHEFSSEATEYPVESGGDITENVRSLPIVVTLSGIVSDTPLAAMAALRSTDSLPSAECLAVLEGIREAREPIAITTSLRSFDNMVMTKLEVPRDAETGAALRFSATFQQVIFVTNNRTTVRVATPSNGKQVALGAKEAALRASSKHLPWRKGVPPGAPLKPGFETEEIAPESGTTIDDRGNTQKTKYYIRLPSRRPLTNAEVQAATLDFQRDGITAAQARAFTGDYDKNQFSPVKKR